MKKLLFLFALIAFIGCDKSDNEEKTDHESEYNDSQNINNLTYYSKLSGNNAILDIKKDGLIINEISWPIKGGISQIFNSFGESINIKIEGVYIQDYKVVGDNVYILIRYLNKEEQTYGIHELLHIKDNKIVNNSFIKKQITDHSGIPCQLKEWYDGSILVQNNPAINSYEKGNFFLLFDKNHNLLLDDQEGFPVGEYVVNMYQELLFSVGSFDADTEKQRITLIYKDIRKNTHQWIYVIYKGDVSAKIINKELNIKDNIIIGNIQYTLENGEKFSKDFMIDINTGEDI